jgi:hypothetical protein
MEPRVPLVHREQLCCHGRALSRPSTHCHASTLGSWMPGTRPGMTGRSLRISLISPKYRRALRRESGDPIEVVLRGGGRKAFRLAVRGLGPGNDRAGSDQALGKAERDGATVDPVFSRASPSPPRAPRAAPPGSGCRRAPAARRHDGEKGGRPSRLGAGRVPAARMRSGVSSRLAPQDDGRPKSMCGRPILGSFLPTAPGMAPIPPQYPHGFAALQWNQDHETVFRVRGS